MPSRAELLKQVKITVWVDTTHTTYQKIFYDPDEMEIYIRRVVKKFKKKDE